MMDKFVCLIGGPGDGIRRLHFGPSNRYLQMGHIDVEGRMAIYEYEETKQTGRQVEIYYRYVKSLDTDSASKFIKDNSDDLV